MKYEYGNLYLPAHCGLETPYGEIDLVTKLLVIAGCLTPLPEPISTSVRFRDIHHSAQWLPHAIRAWRNSWFQNNLCCFQVVAFCCNERVPLRSFTYIAQFWRLWNKKLHKVSRCVINYLSYCSKLKLKRIVDVNSGYSFDKLGDMSYKPVRGICYNLVLHTVYPKKYAHGCVVLCFVVVMQSFIMNSHEVFIHIHQGCFAGTGAIVRLPQCQWSKPDGYGKISQCITTTKHSKAKTVCIFLGIYCLSCLHQKHQ